MRKSTRSFRYSLRSNQNLDLVFLVKELQSNHALGLKYNLTFHTKKDQRLYNSLKYTSKTRCLAKPSQTLKSISSEVTRPSLSSKQLSGKREVYLSKDHHYKILNNFHLNSARTISFIMDNQKLKCFKLFKESAFGLEHISKLPKIIEVEIDNDETSDEEMIENGKITVLKSLEKTLNLMKREDNYLKDNLSSYNSMLFNKRKNKRGRRNKCQ